MSRKNKKERQQEATERLEEYSKLSLKEKIELAQSRRGNSTKEINKLRSQNEKRHKE